MIAVAMNLPADLTTIKNGSGDLDAKSISIFFSFAMLSNFLPSLGLVGDKELLIKQLNFSETEVQMLRGIWKKLAGRRNGRKN